MNRAYAVVTAFVLAGAAIVATPQTPPKTAAPAKAPAPQTAMPPAIDAAFHKAYPAAVVKNVSKETEDGKTIYEVESVDNGRRRDINYNPDGTVILYEEELRESDVPAVVISAVKTRYPKAVITLFERLYTAKDNSTNFELGLKGAPVSEVILTPEGKWVSPKPPKSPAFN